MKPFIKLFKPLFWDMNSLYMLEIFLIVAGITISIYGFQPGNSGIYLNSGSMDRGILSYQKLGYYISYGIFNIYHLFILIIGVTGIFIFSLFISKNKFSSIYLLGYKRKEIILAYYTIFLFYSIILIVLSFILILQIVLIGIIYRFVFYFSIFVIADLMFYLSTGFLIAIITKNSIIPGAFVLILYYIAIPSIFSKSSNTLQYGIFNSISYFLNYGFSSIEIQALTIKIFIALLLISISIAISYYSNMKVVR